MTDKKVWFITGAGRGFGVDIAKAALAAGDAVVATARKSEDVTAALGQEDEILAVKLDITDPIAAMAAVQSAVERFGQVDVLVNNAGNFNAGFFEEITPVDFRAQIETTLFEPVNVTVQCFLSCERSVRVWSSRSPRLPASWAKNSAPPMRPPSLAWRGGSSP